MRRQFKTTDHVNAGGDHVRILSTVCQSAIQGHLVETERLVNAHAVQIKQVGDGSDLLFRIIWKGGE